MIASKGASLKISHCILRLGASDRLRTRLACINIENAPSCDFRSTAFSATPGKAIVWRSNAEGAPSQTIGHTGNDSLLTLSNCVVNASALWLDLATNTDNSLQMIRCTFKGPDVLVFPSTASIGNLLVIAQNNLFAAGAILRDSRKLSNSLPRGGVRWQERENLFGLVLHYIAPPSRFTRDRGPVRTLAEWNNWWRQTNHQCREVKVNFVSGPARPDRDLRAQPEYTLSTFQVADLEVLDGPPLERNEWGRFGANTADVGPASPK
jgi:hypothetical protein